MSEDKLKLGVMVHLHGKPEEAIRKVADLGLPSCQLGWPPNLTIEHEPVAVHAKIFTINGFSAHANAAELDAATAPLASVVKKAFLVHGEADQSQALAKTMTERGFRDVHVVAGGETFDLH